MKLQTTIPLKPERNQIDYTSKVLLLGSCFTESIGQKLSYFKFQKKYNHFGIIFNPVAIEKLITRAINEVTFTEEDVFFYNEQWHCFEVHSSLSNTSKSLFLSTLNQALEDFKTSLLDATHIILTIGTSWVYREIESDEIVANCHKIPQKKFLKELLSPDDVSDVLLGIEVLIRDVNPSCVLINTVSPVRHVKDGIVENSRSKAHLIAGVHEIVDVRKGSYYFPSFEIMMDELRDYRFYKEDLIHPSTTAITIIWERFKNVWISEATNSLQKEIDSIQKGLRHRSFNPESEAHKEFEVKLQERKKIIKAVIPHCNFD